MESSESNSKKSLILVIKLPGTRPKDWKSPSVRNKTLTKEQLLWNWLGANFGFFDISKDVEIKEDKIYPAMLLIYNQLYKKQNFISNEKSFCRSNDNLNNSAILKSKIFKESHLKPENNVKDKSSDSESLPSLSKTGMRSVESYYSGDDNKRILGTPSPSFTPESASESDVNLPSNVESISNLYFLSQPSNSKVRMEEAQELSTPYSKSTKNINHKSSVLEQYYKTPIFNTNSGSDDSSHSLIESLDRHSGSEFDSNVQISSLHSKYSHLQETSNVKKYIREGHIYGEEGYIKENDSFSKNENVLGNSLQKSTNSSAVSKVRLEGMVTNVVTRDNSPFLKSEEYTGSPSSQLKKKANNSHSSIILEPDAFLNQGIDSLKYLDKTKDKLAETSLEAKKSVDKEDVLIDYALEESGELEPISGEYISSSSESSYHSSDFSGLLFSHSVCHAGCLFVRNGISSGNVSNG
ncbi:hypothetical protein AYI68_g349 [Smittium mucronatum]|uniref:Uncharacterized protein n=1 Tax=Smittium mucronatum TaxID=133383 RepID=A0A1R0H8E3_9FUNG|nr:hypothetical protein AYI68_g349 [Smittium mucronatum]